MKEVKEGHAIIELFYWEDKPYRSKQIVFATLDKDSGCEVQRLFIDGEYATITSFGEFTWKGLKFDERSFTYNFNEVEIDIAKNDALSLEDFKAWFKCYDPSKPMAIIQFTKLFRY